MSDLGSGNDVATNGVNVRSGNKMWWKCECCALMETSIEGVCCLEITEICKPTFSSTSCLNVCRSDEHFVLWYSRRENFVSYLISTQFWSLANQNFLSLLSSWLLFSVNIFLYWSDFFLYKMFFCEHIFSKKQPIWFRGSVIIEKQYLIIRIARSTHSQVLKNLLFHKKGHRFVKFSICHFSGWETDCTEAVFSSCFSK